MAMKVKTPDTATRRRAQGTKAAGGCVPVTDFRMEVYFDTEAMKEEREANVG
jgi:hypothetical protein